MTDVNVASFEAFLQAWTVRQNKYLEDLRSAQQHCHELQDADLRVLISMVLSHYQQYFEEKSRIAQHNVLLVFSPPWFSSLERTFLWIAGFKPGTGVQLVNTALDDLTEEQNMRLRQLKQETKSEERVLNDKLAKIHESVAAPPLVEMGRHHGRLCLNELGIAEENEVPSSLKASLEALVANADELRINTVLKIVEILRPAQTVKLLVAVAELLHKIRMWGLENDKQRSIG
ncbi:hypothetical protein L6164_002330 [Bauhinia variegata]|uniref:Uncharacterized protein n=1 Tax=Bauhinia variegata TaxID=167791 RepID=A0ACB9Q009_BAUVA|nr:hypothetical protein L6164_002330 [Bauhinia variegata]